MAVKIFKSPGKGVLTASMLEFYKEQGFLILEEFISHSTIKLLRERAYKLASEIITGQWPIIHPQHKSQWSLDELEATTKKYCCFWEEPFNDLRPSSRLMKISHALHRLEPHFRDFVQSSDVLQLVRFLSLSQPKVVQSMLHFKPPYSSSAIGWHQDATYIATTPCSTTGLWLALEDATPSNGCLQVIAGAHRQGLSVQMIRTPLGELSFKQLQRVDWLMKQPTSLPVKAGTLIILHGLLPHSSLNNSSESSRLSLTLHLFDEVTKYSDENWLPLEFL